MYVQGSPASVEGARTWGSTPVIRQKACRSRIPASRIVTVKIAVKMDSDQALHKPIMDEVNDHPPSQSFSAPDAPVLKLADSSPLELDNKDKGKEGGAEQPKAQIKSLTPVNLDPLETYYSESRYVEALETVESARSSRSGTIYDETPPDIDVGTHYNVPLADTILKTVQ
jgi:hypothetical protein